MSGFDSEFFAHQRAIGADAATRWTAPFQPGGPFHFVRQQTRRKRRLLDREVQDYLDLHPHPRTALEYSDMVEEITRRLRTW